MFLYLIMMLWGPFCSAFEEKKWVGEGLQEVDLLARYKSSSWGIKS